MEEQTSPQQTDHQAESTGTEEKKSFLLSHIYLVSFLTAFFTIGLFIFVATGARFTVPSVNISSLLTSLQRKPQSSPSPTPSTVEPSSSPFAVQNSASPSAAPFALKEDIVFFRDNQVWIRRTNGNEAKIQISHDGIAGFAYSPVNKLLATLEGKKMRNENGYSWIEPAVVNLRSLNGNSVSSPQEIVRLDVVKATASADYVVELRSVGFSPDGKILGITSSDSFWTYTVASQKLEQIFSRPIEPSQQNNRGIVYAYRRPIFSFDGKHALLNRGYYEGADTIVVNLETKEIKELPFQAGNGGGDSVEAWTRTGDLVTTKNTWEDTQEGQSVSTVRVVSFPSLEEKRSTRLDGMIYDTSFKGNTLYLLSKTTAPFESIDVKKPGIETVAGFDVDSGKMTPLTSRERVEQLSWTGFTFLNDQIVLAQTTQSGSIGARSFRSDLYAGFTFPEMRKVIENAAIQVQ